MVRRTDLTTPARALVVALAGALASGCGPKDDVPLLRADHGSLLPEAGAGDAGGAEDPSKLPPDPLEPWDTAGAGPLTGIFALEAVVKAKVIQTLELEERQLLRVRIVQVGAQLHEKTTVCTLRLPDVKNVASLVIPPPMTDVLRAKSVEVTGDYLSSSDPVGATWTPPPSPFLIGAQLAHPDTDPLPTQAAPAGQVDEDHDGQPGVSVQARVVTCPKDPDQPDALSALHELYVALRTTSSIRGTVASADLITGTDDVSLDLATLGYDDPCMAAATGISSQIAIEPGSAITAKRVGDAEDRNRDGNVSCAEIQAGAVALFGDYWK